MQLSIDESVLQLDKWTGCGVLRGWNRRVGLGVTLVLRPERLLLPAVTVQELKLGEIQDLIAHFLSGSALDVVGLYCSAENRTEFLRAALDPSSPFSTLHHLLTLGNQLILAEYPKEAGKPLVFSLVDAKDLQVKPVEFRVVSNLAAELEKECRLVACDLAVEVVLPATSDSTSLSEALSTWKRQILPFIGFHPLLEPPYNRQLGEVLPENSPSVHQLEAFVPLVSDRTRPHLISASISNTKQLTVSIFAASYIDHRASVSAATEILRAGLGAQLDRLALFYTALAQRPSVRDLVWAYFPAVAEESGPVESALRQALHATFFLPLTRPCLRRHMDYRSAATSPSGAASIGHKLLSNVHTSVRPPNAQGKVYLVQGAYDYHHYGQGDLNDAGWGCAYRSMQSLVSWLIHQRFVSGSRKVPSHPDIQRTLVRIGDKPTSFLRSKEWIGAIEISMCLEEEYQISSKILHIRSGAEISTIAQQLAAHFEQIGSPVMVGGGVLAYTLLGIFIPSSGNPSDYRYLILDPHYTGKDVLTTIVQQGWCAWQPPGKFLEKNFYNLCLPQPPMAI